MAEFVAEFVIKAQKRTIVGKKVSQIRAQGLVPGTVYGAKTDPINLQIPYRDVEGLLKQAGGTNLIDVKIGKKTYPVIARDVQRDVLKDTILHVDFFAVDETTKIRADIPIRLAGESPQVTARAGILLTGTNTLTVEMLPQNLMNQIEIDLTQLEEIGDSIMVKDLDLETVTIINDPNEMLARIVQPSAARAAELEAAIAMEEGEAVEGEAAGEVEVIGEAEAEAAELA